VAAERVGQGEMDRYQHWDQITCTWLLLGLAVESPWLALGRPFLSYFARMGLEKSSQYVGSPFLLFSWSVEARTMTIESSLESECGLSRKSTSRAAMALV